MIQMDALRVRQADLKSDGKHRKHEDAPVRTPRASASIVNITTQGAMRPCKDQDE
jgi:hypothetical protein